MGQARACEAAADAGIRLTLLDALYLQGGFDAPLAGPQLRFGDGDADGWVEPGVAARGRRPPPDRRRRPLGPGRRTRIGS